MKKTTSIFLVIFLLGLMQPMYGQKFKTVNLRCENSINPLGIDIAIPRLSWNIVSADRNCMQAAFQIMVASDSLLLKEDNADVWNSGKISSPECLYITFNGKPLQSLHRYYWKVKVWDEKDKATAWSNIAWWNMAMLSVDDWKGKWISSDIELTALQKELKAMTDFGMELESEIWKIAPDISKRSVESSSAPAVYLRKEFETAQSVKYAVASVCGLGLNELYINGNKVSNDLLNPAVSDYQKRIMYQSYDVTSYLNAGKNTVGVVLGNGWFNLIVPHVLRFYAADYIAPPRLLCQIDIFYTDGSIKTIFSDETWKFTTDGPIRYNDLLSGETYDANKEMLGWNKNSYKETDWKPAIKADAPGGKLYAQHLYPVRIIDSIKAISIIKNDSCYVVKLEKELTGWCKVKLKGAKGEKITVKYPGANSHTLGRYQTYEYILKGEGTEVFDARFSYNGIKEVEIYGLDYQPELSDITGILVNTDFPITGSFSCSNNAFNELWQLLVNTMRNYVVHIPNDPVREKAGWTQDVQGLFDVYSYTYESKSMFDKWQYDFLDIIHENGYVPPVIPSRFDGPTINGPWWGGMIVLQPWKIYQHYGDKKILAESFDSMKKYLSYLESIDSSYIVKWGLGDWLEVGSVRPVRTPVSFTSTLGFYQGALITAKTASILGYKDYATYYFKLADTIKVAFNQNFFNAATGEYALYSQASQVMPLNMKVVPNDKRALVTEKLIQKIVSDSNHISTGFVSTPFILEGLSDLGYGEVAYTIANQRSFPGWYDMVFNHGSKIFKEDWKGGLVQMPPLGGSLGDWFFYSLAGIQVDEVVPGFKNIIIKPDFVKDLSWVKGSYKSLYGTIKTNWKREGNSILLNVEIPANTTADVYLPGRDLNKINEGGKSLEKQKGIQSVKIETEKTKIHIGSGSYIFKVKLD